MLRYSIGEFHPPWTIQGSSPGGTWFEINCDVSRAVRRSKGGGRPPCMLRRLCLWGRRHAARRSFDGGASLVSVNALPGVGNSFEFPRGFAARRWQTGGGGAPWRGGAGSAERPAAMAAKPWRTVAGSWLVWVWLDSGWIWMSDPSFSFQLNLKKLPVVLGVKFASRKRETSGDILVALISS